MTSPSIHNSSLDHVRFNIHKTEWRQSIINQLQLRKLTQQSPFEDICSFACVMFDRVDIYKSESIQLNFKKEQLQQQLLGIQQTILAGGSEAAKTILSKLSNVNITDDTSDTSGGSIGTKTLGIPYASLLAEKSQLEKKILDLQENLTDVLKTKSDMIQKNLDLKTQLEEKELFNKQLITTLKEKDKEIAHLRDTSEKLELKSKTLTDEYFALGMSYNCLEKKHLALRHENDALSQQILAVKREDADRLNAENDKITLMQRERRKNEIDSKVTEMNQAQMTKQAAGDPGALALAAMAEEAFTTFDDDQDLQGLGAPSIIPKTVDFSFDAHESETCAVNWYCRGGPRDDYLATGGSDRKVKLWKIADSKPNPVATLLGSNASITSIDIEADSILAGSNDYSTRVWSTTNYKFRCTLTGHSAKVLTAKFLGLPIKAASGSQDRTVKIWDINQGSCIRTYFAGSCCYDLVYNNYQVITGHFDNKIRCWDLKKQKDNEPTGLIQLSSKITSLDISKDETKLLCSLRDNTIKCLDLRKMEVLQTYSDERFRIGSECCRAKFSIDGQYIACGSTDGSLYIWDTNTAKLKEVLVGHGTTLVACSWSPDGRQMVSIERGKKVSIWC